MDFFAAQDAARRRTHLLVALFCAAVLSIIVAVYVVVTITGTVAFEVAPGFDPALFGIVALGTGLLIGLGSAFRTAQLRRGGPAVAELLGGRSVSPATDDPAERRLVNVVEEMAVASGIPVPGIYVLEGERSINAFAAGYGIHDAVVAVTRGTLEKLDREELQGVVAHEFSHVLNGDMRLNIRLVGLLFGILLLAVVGRGIVRGGMVGRRRKGGGQTALLGLALILLGYIGVFFGKLIKAAVSRQREFLADASAVQFTRNPRGIAGALERIGADAAGSKISDHHAEELSHLFFANGLGGALFRLTSTHPPLEERIRRIDPGWDGTFRARPPSEVVAEASGTGRTSGRAGPGMVSRAGAETGAPGALLLGTAALMASVGRPGSDHVDAAREILARVPDELQDAAHDPAGAQALLLVLLGREGAAAAAETLANHGEADPAEPDVRAWTDRLQDALPHVDPRWKLPLLDLALPTLRRLPPERAEAFRGAAEGLIWSDSELRTFDFALMHILWRHLPGGTAPRKASGSGGKRLSRLRAAADTVLTAVARAGSDPEGSGAAAYARGTAALGMADLRFRPEGVVNAADLDGALSRLEEGSLQARRKVLEACAAAVLEDARVRPEEAELLRAVAECLQIPLPPLAASPVREAEDA